MIIKFRTDGSVEKKGFRASWKTGKLEIVLVSDKLLYYVQYLQYIFDQRRFTRISKLSIM